MDKYKEFFSNSLHSFGFFLGYVIAYVCYGSWVGLYMALLALFLNVELVYPVLKNAFQGDSRK